MFAQSPTPGIPKLEWVFAVAGKVLNSWSLMLGVKDDRTPDEEELWPRTGAILRSMTRSYAYQAKHEDIDSDPRELRWD